MKSSLPVFSSSDVPRLPRGVRLRFDPVRNTRVLLAPERTFELDQVATDVLELVDGVRTVDAIVQELQMRYHAKRGAIEADVLAMLSDLAGKRVLER